MSAWSIPREWSGETAFILGGGLSLAGVDVSVLRDHRVISVNEAGLSIAPWCDVLYWPDARWLEWNFDRLPQHVGQYKLTRAKPTARTKQCDPDLSKRIAEAIPTMNVHHLERDHTSALSIIPTRVAGVDGGSNAVNIAFHFGVARIVLLGFDMREGSFHGRHLKRPVPGSYEKFAKSLCRMGEALEDRNVEVLNATTNSALMCFPKVLLRDVL